MPESFIRQVTALNHPPSAEPIFVEDARKPSVASRLVWATLLLVPTPLLIALFMQAALPIPRLLSAVGAIAAAVIGVAGWQRDRYTPRPRRLVWTLLITSGFLVGGAILWNFAYLQYAELVPRAEIFRRALFRYTTPAYGLPDIATFARAWPVIALAVAAAAWVMWARFDIRMTKRRLLGLMLVFFVGAALFARSEPAEGRERNVIAAQKAKKKATTRPAVDSRRDGQAYGFKPFREDAKEFTSPANLLKTYVEKMPTLSWFGRHYPPGSAMLFWFEVKAQKTYATLYERVRGKSTKSKPPFAMWFITLVAAAAVVPVCKSAKELVPGRPRVQQLAALVYVCSAGPLIFSSISTTPLILLPAAMAVWAALRGARTGHWFVAVILGLCLPLFALVSFSAVYFAIALAACFALCWVFELWPRRNLLKTAIVSGVVALAFVGVLRLLGFDLIACARIGVEEHHAQAATSGFDGLGLYFMRWVANTMAFSLMNLPILGVVLATALLWRKPDWRRRRHVLLPAAIFGIVAAGLSGSFFMETERIWVFFLPLLAVAAAVELGRYDDPSNASEARWVIVMMIAFAVVEELYFIHYIA